MEAEDFKEWDIEEKLLSELNPADYNPRIITSSALEGLKNSITKFGLVKPIIWNKRTGNIVGGHQRFKALSESGVEKAEVVVVDFDEDDELALNVSLNNPEIESSIKEEAIDLLDNLAGSLKETFSKLKFDDFRQQLEEEFRAEPEQVQKIQKPKVEKKKNKEVVPDTHIIIECPKCSARFRKSDKKVIEDSIQLK